MVKNYRLFYPFQETIANIFDNLIQLDHPNIMKFHNFWMDDDNTEQPRVIFIKEYMSSGEIYIRVHVFSELLIELLAYCTLPHNDEDKRGDSSSRTDERTNKRNFSPLHRTISGALPEKGRL